MRRLSCLFAALSLSLYLGLHKGYIALWNSERTQPVHIFPYCAAAYPNIDQNALCQGIPITSEEELTRLLEDYLS